MVRSVGMSTKSSPSWFERVVEAGAATDGQSPELHNLVRQLQEWSCTTVSELTARPHVGP